MRKTKQNSSNRILGVVKKGHFDRFVVKPLARRIWRQGRSTSKKVTNVLERVQFLEDLIDILAQEVARQGKRLG